MNNRQGLAISHLQYADDTLIFCDADSSQLKYLGVILIHFEAISGLHINWRKSFIFPVNEVPRINMLANILGGKIGDLPTTYLGMPLGEKSRSKGIWNNILEKCEKKLVNWKSQYLSLGGRVTLINSVLDALPTYMMSVFHMPANVIDRMDAIRRNFLWQGNLVGLELLRLLHGHVGVVVLVLVDGVEGVEGLGMQSLFHGYVEEGVVLVFLGTGGDS
ncbi:uncharacterized protein LOC125863802 [Solanum stenotomum]|uniref:uncharacterized protein LOC125863802 n=1 Tax=Solanum stenotomum TaxID=172797 RepID=UPI0020D12B52|nr:uncharacterized protein LOC125863802 [Solanum stenotomum]